MGGADVATAYGVKGDIVMISTRRFFLSLLAALPLSGLARAAQAQRTPAAMEGPFYPTGAMRFADADNNLVRITGLVRDAGGEVIILRGRVLDRDGRARRGCARRDLAMRCERGLPAYPLAQPRRL